MASLAFDYPARRGFSLACPLALTQSFVDVACLTSPANDFVNVKRHAREKRLLARWLSNCLLVQFSIDNTYLAAGNQKAIRAEQNST